MKRVSSAKRVYSASARLRRCHWPARRGGALHEVLAGLAVALQAITDTTERPSEWLTLRLALKSLASTQRPVPLSPRTVPCYFGT